MPDYKKIPVDVTTVVNNGAATANDLVGAVAAIYDNLWAVSNTDRDTMQTQLLGLVTRAKAAGSSGKIRTPGGGFMVIR
jgi:hypothetical protein